MLLSLSLNQSVRQAERQPLTPFATIINSLVHWFSTVNVYIFFLHSVLFAMQQEAWLIFFSSSEFIFAWTRASSHFKHQIVQLVIRKLRDFLYTSSILAIVCIRAFAQWNRFDLIYRQNFQIHDARIASTASTKVIWNIITNDILCAFRIGSINKRCMENSFVWLYIEIVYG